MPRPSLAEVRRPELLDAYARSLMKHGPEGATLDRIAEEAGVTRGLVRHYLGNREEVDRALMVYLRERYMRGFTELGTGRPASERLPAILDAMFSHRASDLSGPVDTLLGASGDDPVLRDELRTMYVELERLLEAEIAATYPEADPIDRRRAAYGVLCLAGMNDSLSALGFPSDRPDMARASADRLIQDLG